MTITRRAFFAGLGAVSVSLLFHRRLDAVLESLEQDLANEPVVPEQLPVAAEIVIRPQMSFRPSRLIVSSMNADTFLIENIYIGDRPQLANYGGISAVLFTAATLDTFLHLDTAAPGTEIRFRVRYIGSDPAGARFQAALLGQPMENGNRVLLPVDSSLAITA